MGWEGLYSQDEEGVKMSNQYELVMSISLTPLLIDQDNQLYSLVNHNPLPPYPKGKPNELTNLFSKLI